MFKANRLTPNNSLQRTHQSVTLFASQKTAPRCRAAELWDVRRTNHHDSIDARYPSLVRTLCSDGIRRTDSARRTMSLCTLILRVVRIFRES